MAEQAPPAQKPRIPTGVWVACAIVLLLLLQAGPVTYLVISDGMAAGFDWAGFIGFTLGSIAIPLVLGCLGLLWRKRRGLGFFLVSVTAYLLLEAARIVATVGA